MHYPLLHQSDIHLLVVVRWASRMLVFQQESLNLNPASGDEVQFPLEYRCPHLNVIHYNTNKP